MPSAQIVLSAITLVVGVLTAVLVWRSNTSATGQREQQARREEWWRRFQAALAMARDEDKEHARLGAELLRVILRSTLMGPDEQEIAVVVFKTLYTGSKRSLNGAGNEGGSGE